MSFEIRLLVENEFELLESAAPDVFDHEVDPRLAAEFLADPRHHLAVAIDDGVVVGMATAVHYVHPDKPPELWIDEVGVAASHRRQGIARRLLDRLLEHGRELGCIEAWVLAEAGNEPAERLYAAAGGRASRATMFSFRL